MHHRLIAFEVIIVLGCTYGRTDAGETHFSTQPCAQVFLSCVNSVKKCVQCDQTELMSSVTLRQVLKYSSQDVAPPDPRPHRRTIQYVYFNSLWTPPSSEDLKIEYLIIGSDIGQVRIRRMIFVSTQVWPYISWNRKAGVSRESDPNLTYFATFEFEKVEYLRIPLFIEVYEIFGYKYHSSRDIGLTFALSLGRNTKIFERKRRLEQENRILSTIQNPKNNHLI